MNSWKTSVSPWASGQAMAVRPISSRCITWTVTSADEARCAFGIGDQLEVLAGEFLDLAVRQHDPGADDVVREPAVLVGADAGAALGQPAADRGRRVAGGIEAQRQAVRLELPVQLSPR